MTISLHGLHADAGAKRARRAAVAAAPRVLLVEDDALHRLVAVKLLERLGCRVVATGDGFDALTQLGAGGDRYDLVIVDIHMPGMTGVEVARRIRRDPAAAYANVPILALSAAVHVDTRDGLLRAGIDAIYQKPLRAERFLAAVRALLWG